MAKLSDKEQELLNDKYCKDNNINPDQRAMLVATWIHCDEEDKSTEYMFALMSDMGDLSYDDTVEFVMNYKRTSKDFK
tara:strand:+ start:6352 stop:6585 length:234 start_codon:yes stop_codon:yes gene_type:complete